jgi:hypothetical protein
MCPDSPRAVDAMDARQARADARQARAARLARFVPVVAIAAAAWLALTMSATAQDPSGSPAPAAEGSSTPTHPPIPTPGPSDNDWLFATPVPTLGPAPATAPPLASPPVHVISPDGQNSCYDCHSAVNDTQAAISTEWQESAHGKAGIGCADCHGGDPTTDQITKAMDPAAGYAEAPGRAATVALCGSCHGDAARMKASALNTDQYAKYFTSVHGQRLLAGGDERVAICTDCHGVHDIRKVSDPSAKTFALNVPELCASCHADERRMEPYGIPTDQLDVYAGSVHGIALLENKDIRAPSCVGCHGSHDAQPPTSDTVVNICGKCHTATEDLYKQSRHSELEAAAPKCWTCHGTHDVGQPTSAIFFHPEKPDYTCTTCHDLTTHTLRLELDRFQAEEDRRCDTCHHESSEIYAQIEGIYREVTEAEAAFEGAGARIEEAARLGMITADAEVALANAKTSLIQAQAAVHTTKLKTVAELSVDAKQKAAEAEAMALAKVDESQFRRVAMVVIVALIAACVLYLVMLKRRLDRDLE